MTVPMSLIVPLFIAAFVVVIPQYWKLNPERRVLNLRFGLMLGAFLLAIAEIALQPSYSWLFLGVGVGWLAVAIRLRRAMPAK